jgi:hypothetical protein
LVSLLEVEVEGPSIPCQLEGDVKPSVQAATFSSDTDATLHGMHGSDIPKDDTSATSCNTAGMTTSQNITAGANHSSLAYAANHSKPAQINSVKGNPSRQIFLIRQILGKPGNQYFPCPSCLNHSTTVQFYPRYSSSIHGIKDKSIRQANTGRAHQDLTMRSSSRGMLIKH